MNSFRARLRQNSPLLGAMVTLSAPEIAELWSMAGFDWLLIDLEHGALDMCTAQQMIQAMRGECAALVRVPENSAHGIGRVLDAGAAGVIVPRVNTPEEAQAAVAAARFPPEGERSVGIARAHGYGANMSDSLRRANDEVAVIIQVEHREAVRNLGSILAVSGIDGVLIGPYDLSGSLGHLGDLSHSDVQAAVRVTRDACLDRGIAVGMFVLDADAARTHIDQGCRFVLLGADSLYLWQGARAMLNQARQTQE